MKALSIRQPWAWAIVHAGKDVENRDWHRRGGNWHGSGSAFRGEFLIHVSQRPNPTRLLREAQEFVDFCKERDISLPDGAEPGKLTANDLFRDCGGIVGIARVVDIRPNPSPRSSPWEIDGCLGLVLADARPVPFAPCKGALGFWNVPADVLAAVEKARTA